MSASLAQLSPATLGAILRETETGRLERWADLCDRMVHVDAHVRASYETRLAAVSGSRRTYEPGRPTGDPERDRWSAAAVEFVERVIESIPGIDQAAHDTLDAIGKGASALEIPWTVDGGDVVPECLAWVHLRRFRWSIGWELLLVDDGDTYSPTGVPLEPGRWIVHVPRTTSGYPTMTGVLRAVAWPYLFKRWGQQFWLSGAERFAWPFVWAKVPRDAGAEVRAKALAGLESLSADHAAVLEEPAAFELLESATKDAGTWKEFHAAMNGEIAKAILGMTDVNEPSRVGAYAAVEARAGVTVDARIALDERALAGTWRRDLISWLISLNTHRFGGVIPPIPSVRWAVASKRREIPPHLMTLARVNELRASIDLPPVAGPIGDRFYSDRPLDDPDDGAAPSSPLEPPVA